MSKSNALENDLLANIFNGTALPWSAGVTYYLALHNGDPGEGGNQTTNEVAYTSYARVSVLRNAGGWTVAGNQVQNTALVQFPTCTGGSDTASYCSIGTLAAGAGQIMYSGILTSPLNISNNITPQFALNALTITED